MLSEGHLGVSLLVAAPIVTVLVYFELFVLAVGFTVTVVLLASFPDVDIHLQKLTGKNGIPILRRFITLQHRGFTHTIWFALLFGGIASLLGVAIAPQTDLSLQMVYWGVMFLAGFLGIVNHVIGDIVTPSGINFAPPFTSTAFSLDWFRYDNLIGNVSAAILGKVAITLGVFVGLEPASVELWVAYGAVYVVAVPASVFIAKRIGWQYNRHARSILSFLGVTWVARKLSLRQLFRFFR